MHSRELVYKTLDFNSHQRVPRDLWVLPWARENYPQELQKIQARFPSDFVSAPARYATPVLTTGDPYLIGTFTDDWGCTFVNIQNNKNCHSNHPPSIYYMFKLNNITKRLKRLTSVCLIKNNSQRDESLFEQLLH